jgi:hypothetical protein
VSSFLLERPLYEIERWRRCITVSSEFTASQALIALQEGLEGPPVPRVIIRSLNVCVLNGLMAAAHPFLSMPAAGAVFCCEHDSQSHAGQTAEQRLFEPIPAAIHWDTDYHTYRWSRCRLITVYGSPGFRGDLYTKEYSI